FYCCTFVATLLLPCSHCCTLITALLLPCSCSIPVVMLFLPQSPLLPPVTALCCHLSSPCSYCCCPILHLITMISLLFSYCHMLAAALTASHCCTLIVTFSLPCSYCCMLIASYLLPCSHHCTLVAKLLPWSCCPPLLCSCHCIFVLSLFLPSYSYFCPMFILIPHFQISPSHSIPCHVSCSILCVLSHPILHFIPP